MRVSTALLQCGAVCCSVLQCVAACCSVLQRVAVCVYGAPLVWHCRDHFNCEGERVDARYLQRVTATDDCNR